MKLFSYVVQHDYGLAPNPYSGFCTLCLCKRRQKRGDRPNVVELAKRAKDEGEVVWVLGTGGADPKRSAGNGKIVYAMQVDEVLSRGEYYEDPRFRSKRPVRDGTYEGYVGDNAKPKDEFEKRQQFVLVSSHFFYFGQKAAPIPRKFGCVVKRGPGFRSQFEDGEIKRFVEWVEQHEPGMQGEPSGKQWHARNLSKDCGPRGSCLPRWSAGRGGEKRGFLADRARPSAGQSLNVIR